MRLVRLGILIIHEEEAPRFLGHTFSSPFYRCRAGAQGGVICTWTRGHRTKFQAFLSAGPDSMEKAGPPGY